MSKKELKNKPLVEAILEIRWRLEGKAPAPQIDPHYKLLLGRLFDRMIGEYTEHEHLPSANIPDEMASHVVQHRFRVAKNSWPLIQVGPGIFTVNSTDDYKWTDFRPRVLSAINRLYDAHPKVDDLKISNIILWYIDAVDFDYNQNNSFDFLKDKLKLNILLPENLFEDTDIEYFSNLLSEGKIKTFKHLTDNQIRISPNSLDVADWQRFYNKFRPSVSKRLIRAARQLKDTEAFLPASSTRRVKGVMIINSGDYNLPTDLLFRLIECKMKHEWRRNNFSAIDFVSCMTVDMYRPGDNILHSRHIARTTRDSDIVEAIKHLHENWLKYVGAAMGLRIKARAGDETRGNLFDLSTPFVGKIFTKE